MMGRFEYSTTSDVHNSVALLHACYASLRNFVRYFEMSPS